MQLNVNDLHSSQWKKNYQYIIIGNNRNDMI